MISLEAPQWRISLLKDEIGDFANWWVGTLRGCMRKKASPKENAANYDLIVEISVNGSLLNDVPTPEDRKVARLPAAIAETTRSLLVVVPLDRVLKRNVAAKRLPMSRLRSIARLDLATSTPFSADQVSLCFQRHSKHTGGMCYFILKRGFLAEAEKSLSHFSKWEKTLAVLSGDEILELDFFKRKINWRTRFNILLIVIGLCAPLVGFSYALANAFAAEAELGQSLKRVIDREKALKPRFREITSERTLLKNISQYRTDAVGLVALLDELTNRLPDGTFLESFRVEDERLDIVGYSDSAPGLLEKIEASEVFSGTTFTGAITRSLDQRADRFEITTGIAR